MRIKVYVIDLELSRRTKRIALLAGVPLALLLGGAAVVYANVPNTFAAGQPLSAQAMNQNFTSLDQRLTALEAFEGQATSSGTYSLGAVYCGATPATNGSVGGYAGAKARCVTACGAPTAHMCTGDELARSNAVGKPTPAGAAAGGWFAAGAVADYTTNAVQTVDDCMGWLSGGGDVGATWSNSLGMNGPVGARCSTPLPVYCCN